MVWLSACLCWGHRTSRRHTDMFLKHWENKPDHLWASRRVRMMQAHIYYTKRRQCYRLGRSHHLKQLQIATRLQNTFEKDMADLSLRRLEAAAKELDYDGWIMREALTRVGLDLNHPSLVELAVWEPRSFRCLVALAADKSRQEPSQGGHGRIDPGPEGVQVVHGGRL